MLSSLRRRLTYANLVATIALFVALGGTSYAAIVITGKNVRDSSLTSRDVKDKSLLARDFRPGQIPAGAPGAPGEKGEKGDKGDQGVPGPASDRLVDEFTTVGTQNGYSMGSPTSAAGATRTFTLSAPARIRVERDVSVSRNCTGGSFTPTIDVSARLYRGTAADIALDNSGDVVAAKATLAHIPNATLASVRITLLSNEVLQPGTYSVRPLAACRGGTFANQIHYSSSQQVYTVE